MQLILNKLLGLHPYCWSSVSAVVSVGLLFGRDFGGFGDAARGVGGSAGNPR